MALTHHTAVKVRHFLHQLAITTDISQYRLRFGFSLLYKTVFYLNSLTAQPYYEGRAAVEGGK
jgi:hypothetical protein